LDYIYITVDNVYETQSFINVFNAVGQWTLIISPMNLITHVSFLSLYQK
jgi:hypothetical protein